jgi:paraquat-inducible protein A
LPIARAAMLIAVLGGLGLGYRRLWQGRLFRLAESLRGWSMAHVYLAAGAVTYSRVAAQLDIRLLAGGWCFVGGVVFLMIAEASLDRRRIWNAIRPEARASPGVPVVSCVSCQLVLPADRAGGPCPRCDRPLRVRRRASLECTVALTLAATILLYPAFFLPMIISVQPNGVIERTIMDGVEELFGRGFWYLGIIVFVVSVGIPLTKLAVLFWLSLSVRFPHTRLLWLRTRLHRVVDEINPWSFLDPYIVALNASMLAYPGVVGVRPAPGVLAFSMVVVLTMIASRLFDARLMWDAAERKALQEIR